MSSYSSFNSRMKARRVGVYFNDGNTRVKMEAAKDGQLEDDDPLLIAVKAGMKAFAEAYKAASREGRE